MAGFATLKTDMEAKKWRQIAEDVIKYQDFKIGLAAERMRGNLSHATKRNYVINGRYYLKTGKKYSKHFQSSSLFKYIDMVKDEHLQPLTPKSDEALRVILPRKKNYAKKEAIPPISQMDIIKNPICAKIEYGVKYNDMIYLMENEKFAQVFVKGIKATGNEAKIVSVEIGEI